MWRMFRAPFIFWANWKSGWRMALFLLYSSTNEMNTRLWAIRNIIKALSYYCITVFFTTLHWLLNKKTLPPNYEKYMYYEQNWINWEEELEQDTGYNDVILYLRTTKKINCWIGKKSCCENLPPVWRNTGSLLSPTSGSLCSMCSARPLHYWRHRPSTCPLQNQRRERRMAGSVDDGCYCHRWLGGCRPLVGRGETERNKTSLKRH